MAGLFVCLLDEMLTFINFHLQVCDNIDLDNILQEYESYYFIKFQKQVKITRKIQLEKNEPKFKPSRIKR